MFASLMAVTLIDMAKNAPATRKIGIIGEIKFDRNFENTKYNPYIPQAWIIIKNA